MKLCILVCVFIIVGSFSIVGCAPTNNTELVRKKLQEVTDLLFQQSIANQQQFLAENNAIDQSESTKSQIGWLIKKQGLNTTVNVTSEFLQLWDDHQSKKPIYSWEIKQKYKYYLVPGLYTMHYPFYFSRNIEYLQGRGFDVELMNIGDYKADIVASKMYEFIINEYKKHKKRVCMKSKKYSSFVDCIHYSLQRSCRCFCITLQVSKFAQKGKNVYCTSSPNRWKCICK